MLATIRRERGDSIKRLVAVEAHNLIRPGAWRLDVASCLIQSVSHLQHFPTHNPGAGRRHPLPRAIRAQAVDIPFHAQSATENVKNNAQNSRFRSQICETRGKPSVVQRGEARDIGRLRFYEQRLWGKRNPSREINVNTCAETARPAASLLSFSAMLSDCGMPNPFNKRENLAASITSPYVNRTIGIPYTESRDSLWRSSARTLKALLPPRTASSEYFTKPSNSPIAYEPSSRNQRKSTRYE